MSLLRFCAQAALLATLSQACAPMKDFDFHAATIANLRAREQGRAQASRPQPKIAIDNVRVFDGYQLKAPGTVVIDGDVIGSDATGAQHMDAQGATLIPGLIDSHCHPANVTNLEKLSSFGVTTAFMMACFKPALCESLKNHTGLTDLRTGTHPAAALGSRHGNLSVHALGNTSGLISNSSQAMPFIEQQVALNPDFVKLVAEQPGLSQESLDILSKTAQGLNKTVVCHAADLISYEQAMTARVNHIHHAPLDKPLNDSLAEMVKKQGQISVPTLTMMLATSKQKPGKTTFKSATDSVKTLFKAGVTILAGTDGNETPGVVAEVPFGSSVHQEMQFLVEAGMKPAEALRAATSRPAQIWGLDDRGVIAPGKRADLMLIDGDPTKDITATRNIKNIWLAGIQFQGQIGKFPCNCSSGQ